MPLSVIRCPVDNPFINQFFHLLYGAKPEPGPLVDFVIDRIWQTDQKVMAERLARLESFDVSDRLWRIDAPTLVLAGARDVIVPVAREQSAGRRDCGRQVRDDLGSRPRRVLDSPCRSRTRHPAARTTGQDGGLISHLDYF